LNKEGRVIPVQVVKASDRSIDAWMPENVPTGAASLTVTVNGKQSRAFALEVEGSEPGLFSQNGDGWGPAVAVNLSKGRSANFSSRPARGGDVVALMATGVTGAVTAVVGNRAVTGEVRATNEVGKQEVTLTIPSDSLEGCWVPVYLQTGSGRASNVVTLVIESKPAPCVSGLLPEGAGRIGVVALSRTQVKRLAKRPRPGDEGATVDDARASFVEVKKDAPLTPLRALPPAGSCAAYDTSFQANSGLAASITSVMNPEGRGLDAGSPLRIARGDQERTISEGAETPGRYRARLGRTNVPNVKNAQPLFLDPGDYVLKAPGGKDVGSFQAHFRMPEPLQWTNRDQLDSVDRGRGITVKWSGAPDLVLIVARNVDQVATVIGMVLCTEKGMAGQFTIPAALLSHVPASSEVPSESYDELAVAGVSLASPIQTRGLNAGWVMSISLFEQFVRYR
jgi:uncharacterized protein (TIGR03437 family)